jgi:tRNA(Ile)-lysidine synthase
MLTATRMADLRLIPSARDVQGLVLIRPLLDVPRSEVLDYCREHALEPRFDRSNLDTTLYRNKLRHELLPYLEREFKPRFREILRRSADVIRADHDLLSRLGENAWQRVVREAADEHVMLDLSGWRALHLALQRAVVRRAVQRLRRNLRDLGWQHVEGAVDVAQRGDAGAQARLPRDLMLTVGYQALWIADVGWVPEPDFPSLDRPARQAPIRLSVPGVTEIGDLGRVEIAYQHRETLPADWAQNPDPWHAYLDAEAVGQELYVRARRPGDRFQPLGLSGKHKLVSDLLVNAHIPSWWRDRVPLLVSADDQILWVCGLRVDRRARIRETTRWVLAVTLYHDHERYVPGWPKKS